MRKLKKVETEKGKDTFSPHIVLLSLPESDDTVQSLLEVAQYASLIALYSRMPHVDTEDDGLLHT